MKKELATISIPEGLDFSALELTREANGSISFSWAVVERICAASKIPVELFRDAPEDNVAGLIVAWYQAHRQQGGAPDTVADDLIAETLAEEAAGQHTSHEPGRA